MRQTVKLVPSPRLAKMRGLRLTEAEYQAQLELARRDGRSWNNWAVQILKREVEKEMGK